MSLVPTTVESLKEDLSIDYSSESLELTLDRNSDLSGLTQAIQRHAEDRQSLKDIFVMCVKYEDTQFDDAHVAGLMSLIEAISQLNICELLVQLPLLRGGLAKMANILRSGETQLKRLEIVSVEFEDDSEPLDWSDEFNSFLSEICCWEDLPMLVWHSSIPLDPTLLEQLAQFLPKLSLTSLFIRFVEPVHDGGTKKDFRSSIAEAFDKLQEGLESNLTLEDMGLSATAEQPLMELVEDKLSVLLRLNALGRKEFISMPLHRDTWLQILSQHTDNLDCIYYYLRRNTWMFTPDKCLAQENQDLRSDNKRLQTELELHQAELEAAKKRHKAELEAKDLEIQEMKARK